MVLTNAVLIKSVLNQYGNLSMKNIQVTICLLLVNVFFIANTQAHAPSEHAAKMVKPKCAAVENMDKSKMDANDPVMMAMMKKCMSKAASEGHDSEGAMKNSMGDAKAEKAAGGNDH